MTIVVVVGRTGSLSPAALADAGSCRDVFERAVMPVAIDVTDGGFRRRRSFERRAVDEEHVEPAVAIDVEHRDATARGLEQVTIGASATVDGELIKPRGLGRVGEGEIDRFTGGHLDRYTTHRTAVMTSRGV